MINVLVVDDHNLVSLAVGRLLSDVPGIQVIGTANSGEEAVEIVQKQRVDVVLMDIKMPGMGGLEATHHILDKSPHTKVLIITSYGGDILPIQLLQAGASGYLTKGVLVEEMIAAIRSVYSGKKHLELKIAQELALKSTVEPNKAPLTELSAREREVMKRITRGESIQYISETLHLSPKTINTYRYRIYEKLNVKNDVELTLLAFKHRQEDT